MEQRVDLAHLLVADQITASEAGLASGIVSTFHEFGAALGAAVVSSIAATSLAGSSSAGFSRGFTAAALVAAATALVTLAVAPGRQARRRRRGQDHRASIRPGSTAASESKDSTAC